jgi:hypothetical protein
MVPILNRIAVPGRKALAADEDQSRSGFAFGGVSSDLRKRLALSLADLSEQER